MTRPMLAAVLLSALPSAGPVHAEPAPPARKPNIIFILADDLGYGDLGCYGQKKIKTPHLDRMAAEGVRFTQVYAGSTVCAPSRCALMTGLHTGHTRVRGNARVPLRPEDLTVAEVLKKAGYATALVGKWGLGEPGSTGVPNKQGFDEFYGYLNQQHAHNHFPDHLWRNEEKITIEGNVVEKGVAVKRAQWSQDLFTREALDFVTRHKDKPFFLYLSLVVPHANNEAGKTGIETPDDKPYSDEPWPQNERNFAASVTKMDADVGKLLAKLKELSIDGETYVFFTSDNGAHREGGRDPDFFASSGPLQGIKRSMHDGGIRVPMIVRRPGAVPAGKVSDQVWAFWDFLPTAAELAGAPAPEKIDGISMAAALHGKPNRTADYLYWEFHEKGFHQAVRTGDWKAIRSGGAAGKLSLFDLSADIGEKTDVAAKYPEVVARIEEYLKTARTENPEFPVKLMGGK
jgi:arylsulfatase A-like enzyme